MNAGYGASTNQYFRYYKDEMAQAITLSGQLNIKWAHNSFNEYLCKLFKDDKKRVIAGDTDSVVGSSTIYVDGLETTIENFFNKSVGEIISNNENGIVKKVDQHYTTKTYIAGIKPMERRILHVMEHEVEKEMFEIEVGGKSVTITGDHSIIVKRDGVLTSATVIELKEGDKFMYLE